MKHRHVNHEVSCQEGVLTAECKHTRHLASTNPDLSTELQPSKLRIFQSILVHNTQSLALQIIGLYQKRSLPSFFFFLISYPPFFSSFYNEWINACSGMASGRTTLRCQPTGEMWHRCSLKLCSARVVSVPRSSRRLAKKLKENINKKTLLQSWNVSRIVVCYIVMNKRKRQLTFHSALVTVQEQREHISQNCVGTVVYRD